MYIWRRFIVGFNHMKDTTSSIEYLNAGGLKRTYIRVICSTVLCLAVVGWILAVTICCYFSSDELVHIYDIFSVSYKLHMKMTSYVVPEAVKHSIDRGLLVIAAANELTV